jgi:hypothetical protein
MGTSCKPDPVVEAVKVKSKRRPIIQNSHEYFPEFAVSSVGRQIKFRALYKTAKKVHKFTTVINLKSTKRIGEDVFVEYVLDNVGLEGSKAQVFYYRVDSRGVWKHVGLTASQSCEAPLPVILDKGWNFNANSKKSYGFFTAIEDLKIGKKVYKNCLKTVYQHALRQGRGMLRATQIEYRSRGLGMVKSVINYENKESLLLEFQSESRP